MKREVKPLPRPHEALAFDPKEFAYVFDLAMHASMRKVDVNKPSKQGFSIVEEDGSIHEYRLGDTPMNRAILAVRDHFSGEQKKSYSAMLRIFALTDLMNSNALSQWTRETEEGREIHNAVLDAAATVNLTKKGKFPRDKFLKEVARIERENYSGEWA